MPLVVPLAKPPSPSASSHSVSRSMPVSGRSLAQAQRRAESAPRPRKVRCMAMHRRAAANAARGDIFQALRDERRPAGLVARSESTTVVAVEKLVEQHELAEAR